MKPKSPKSPSRPSGFKPRLPRALLVFETTGFALRGAVARRTIGGSLVLGAPARSAAPEFATAIGEVLAALRETTKKRLPKTAILVTPSVAGERLLLPVDPAKPRPRAQMHELVRWEIEEVFVRRNEIWSPGAILEGRGHIDPALRQKLEQAAAASGGREHGALLDAYRRHVTPAQFEECLAIQESLAGLDEELSIGWSAQPGADEDGRFAWYCAGLGSGLRDRWAEAFRKNGVFCAWLYPQLGAPLPLASPAADDRLLVDVRQEQFGLFLWKAARLSSLSIQPFPRAADAPETIASAVSNIASDTRSISVSAPDELAAPLADALARTTGTAEIPTLDASASMEGVARHALGLCPAGMMVRVEAQPPRPPVWKTPGFWPWAVIVLLALGIIAIETTLRVRASRNEWRLELLDIDYERQMQVKNEALKTQSEIKHLETVLAGKERELTAKKRRMAVLDDVILYRQKLVPALLRALGEAIPADVVLELLEENNDRSGFYLEGWALTDTEGQRFGNQLNEALVPLGYKVADIRQSRGARRAGVEGFIFKMRLAKTEKNETGKGGRP